MKTKYEFRPDTETQSRCDTKQKKKTHTQKSNIKQKLSRPLLKVNFDDGYVIVLDDYKSVFSPNTQLYFILFYLLRRVPEYKR